MGQMTRVTKARMGSSGAGDACPLDLAHGRMVVMPETDRQYCPHVSHDGRLERVEWPEGSCRGLVTPAVVAHGRVS